MLIDGRHIVAEPRHRGDVAGAETTVTKYENGCPSITEVVLWTTQGGSHLPGFNQSFVPDVVAYLLAHPRP